MEKDDHPPMPALAELQARLASSRKDVEAGRTVPLDEVLAEMRAELAGFGHGGAEKRDDAA